MGVIFLRVSVITLVFFLHTITCFIAITLVVTPEYQLKPSDGRKLNYAIAKQKEAFEKLNGLLKNLKDHDSTLFRANGSTLKHGEKFHHYFIVKHIGSVEAKQLKVSREIGTLEEKKKTSA